MYSTPEQCKKGGWEGFAEEFKNQGGIILEDLEVASDRAEQLASELSQVKPELKTKGCAVRVTDRDHKELYRTPLDPIPRWQRSSARR